MLDHGDYWVPEDFQCCVVEDILGGTPEIMVVIGEGNAKTTLLAGVNLYFADFKPSAKCLVAAASREQAETLYVQAADMVYNSPGFRDRFRTFDGYRRIVAYQSRGRIQIKAADDRTGDGAIFDLSTIDEPHRARDMSLWRTWRGKVDKRGGQILGISTAGDPSSEFEEVRAAMHRLAAESVTVGRHTRSITPGESLIHDWRLNRDDDPTDMAIVKLANPLSTITEESLARKRRSPSMTDLHWARFVCGIPTRATGQGIRAEDFDALVEEGLVAKRGAWSVGFLDMAWTGDTTAMGVLTWERHERRTVTDVKVIHPPVDQAAVVIGLLELQSKFPDLVGIVYDENAGAKQLAQMLAASEHPLQYDNAARAAKNLPPIDAPLPPLEFFGHAQSNSAMAPAAAHLDEAMRMGWIRFVDDPELRRHFLNAVRAPVGAEQFKYDRPSDAKGGERRSRFPIDLLTGVTMGHNYAVQQKGVPRPTAPLIAWA